MKSLTLTFLILLPCITALAQQKNSDSKAAPAEIKNKSAATAKPSVKSAVSPFVSPLSLQILVGSQGVGADVKYGFLSKLSGRLGFGIIPISASREIGSFGFPVQGQLSTSFTNVHLLADYSPFKGSGFRIVGGASYLAKGEAHAIITPTDSYSVGSRSLTKDQIGVVYADVTWKGVAPYLGFAFFRSFPNRLFNINLDLGTYYLSRPGTSFTGTKLLADNDANTKQFNENMKGYRWMPVVQLNFNFRIK